MSQNYINHVGFVVDRSLSMGIGGRSFQVIQVVDGETKYLADRSQQVDQETRVTTYIFDDTVECVFYDKDAMRLPSIKDHYRPRGSTALIDATLKAISDLEQTAQLYGDHAFLLYVVTDGLENASKNRASVLREKIEGLPDNWTIAALVPDQRGIFEAKSAGFPAGNIQVWDTTSAHGFEEGFKEVRKATETFFTGRSSGIRGYRSIFVDSSKLTPKVIKSKLTPLYPWQYKSYTVTRKQEIAEFVQEQTGTQYRRGSGYYSLIKSETIRPNVEVLVYDRANSVLYRGEEARTLIGLPDYEVKVHPTQIPNYEIFVQSQSFNRHLIPGQKVIVL